MDLKEFSLQLQNVYEEMSATFLTFQKETNLPCLPDCCQCCFNPEIEATWLEMIPLAFKIFELGIEDKIYENLENSDGKSCILLNGTKCSFYTERPAVCRMFGVAGYLDKKQNTTLSICKLIKESYPMRAYQLQSEPPPHTPMMAIWAKRLLSLQPHYDATRHPLNISLKIALEKVFFYLRNQENSNI
jgi:Fe-S-cluster containining protein